jgi:hypothetical protein
MIQNFLIRIGVEMVKMVFRIKKKTTIKSGLYLHTLAMRYVLLPTYVPNIMSGQHSELQIHWKKFLNP